MKERDLRKTLNAGKSILEAETLQLGVTLIAIAVDAVLFYISLEATITERWTLNLIVTIAGCFCADVSPLLLAKMLYKEMDKKVKLAACTALTSVFCISLLGFFLVRWTSRFSLAEGSLGLLGEASSDNAAVNTIAFVMGLLPILSSVVVFCFGLLGHDPEKKEKDLAIAAYRSRKRKNEYNKMLVAYGTGEEREANMLKYHKGMISQNEKIMKATAHDLNELANIRLAEKIKADGEQITKIMEKDGGKDYV